MFYKRDEVPLNALEDGEGSTSLLLSLVLWAPRPAKPLSRASPQTTQFGCLRGAEAPFSFSSPSPLKERGIQGVR